MLVSVIVPFYRGNKYMEGLLQSVARNASKLEPTDRVELVIVNDSPEVTVELGKESYDYEIRVIDNPENVGIQKTRITGFQKAEGEYVLFLDQDDLIDDDCLRSQLAHIADCDFCISNGYKTDAKGDKKPIYETAGRQAGCLELKCYYYYKNPIVSPGQVLIRKSAMPKEWLSNPFQENGADDGYLWILLLLEGKKGALNEDCLYTHVYTGENTSLNLGKMMRSEQELIQALAGRIKPRYLRALKRRSAYYGNFRNTVLYRLKYADVGIRRKCYTMSMKGH